MRKLLILFILVVFTLSISSCKDRNNNDNDNDNDNQIEENKPNEAVENLINLIDALPEVITLTDEHLLITVDNEYQKLSENDKKLITNYNKYLSKYEELNLLKEQQEKQLQADKIILLIDSLPEVDDFDFSFTEAVLEVTNQYNSLDEEVKLLVTNFDKLNKLNNLIIELKDANEVVELINLLPDKTKITLDDREKIENIRSLYNELSEELKTHVSNISKLEECEKAISELEKAKEAAQKVINMIDDLPSIEDITYDDKKQVERVRGYYTILSSKAKLFVTNIEKLEAIEVLIDELTLIERYKANALVVINLINTLPSELSINDRELVSECEQAYNELLDVEKPYVSNYDVLVEKSEQMAEIIANTFYDVEVVLNGGYLENMIEEEKEVELFNLNINNYSCNIWTLYSSEIFIYKTTLMNSGDQFTSFIKVGFNLDESSNKYLVEQIVATGTALTSDLKICDYYLLAHADNESGYMNVSNLSVGNILDISTSLPDSQTNSLNANVICKALSGEVTYKITLKGICTIPAPQKNGYIFVGWYLDQSFTSDVVTDVSRSTKVYAKWTVDKGEITTETILNCVSDLVTSDTLDILLLENDDATFTWSSSNNELYNITEGYGRVSKVNQTHKKQKVTVSVQINYKNGNTTTLSKEIIVNPIYFGQISTTPVATYFYTGAISGYKKYNERYLENQTLFSNTTKETLDIIYYAFIIPSSDGSVYIENDSYLNEVRELRNHNVRILGCVTGVNSEASKAFETITASSSLRAKFVKNLMDLVEKYNLDGLDLDWEAVSETLKPIASQYNLLCEELRAEMTLRQDEGGSPYLLTMAVPASSYGTAEDRFDFKTLNLYLDYINIMSYDLNNSSKTTHLSPLHSSTHDNGYGFSAIYGVSRISSLGFDKNKLIIGCAGYGKAYKVNGSGGQYPALGTSGTLTKISGLDGSFASGTVYGSAINQLIKTGKYKQYTEIDRYGNLVGSYLYNSTDKIFITYDSDVAVKAKYEYAALNGLGIMCWAYTEDTSDTVINAIYEAKNQ